MRATKLVKWDDFVWEFLIKSKFPKSTAKLKQIRIYGKANVAAYEKQTECLRLICFHILFRIKIHFSIQSFFFFSLRFHSFESFERCEQKKKKWNRWNQQSARMKFCRNRWHFFAFDLKNMNTFNSCMQIQRHFLYLWPFSAVVILRQISLFSSLSQRQPFA